MASFALLGVGGTPVNLALSPLLAEAKVPHIGPISGDVLRTPTNPRIPHAGQLQRRDRDAGAAVGGHRPKEGGRSFIRQRHRQIGGGRLWPTGQGARAESHADHAWRRGCRIECRLAGLGARPTQRRRMAVCGRRAQRHRSGQAVSRQEPGTPLYTVSLIAAPNALVQLGPAATNMIVSQVLPVPRRAGTSPLRRNSHNAMKASNERVFSHTSVEGYIDGKVLDTATATDRATPTWSWSTPTITPGSGNPRMTVPGGFADLPCGGTPLLTEPRGIRGNPAP